ncbi:hypothetical protein ACQGRZ_27970 [Bacillus wiedmannii]|uniref:hypothetical protein n=1 Tax=Bacillus wiedmannii TaxID=1890302 RepID=UPI003CE860C1
MDESINPLLNTVPIKTKLYVILSGYIGKSSNKSIVRLYSSVEMSHYIDIPSDGIISYDFSYSLTGRTKIFVRGSAYINLVHVIPIRATEVFNGHENFGDNDGMVQTGGNNYKLLEIFRIINRFKKLFKRGTQ